MPFKNREERIAYYKGYNAGYKRATIDHLGGKCEDCGTTEDLEIHHDPPIGKSGCRRKYWKNLKDCHLKCGTHHPDRGTPSHNDKRKFFISPNDHDKPHQVY